MRALIWIVLIIGTFIFLSFINKTSNSSPESIIYPTPTLEVELDNQIQKPTFKGYDCIDDCSGHEAGYQWAAEKGITDPDECSGNSDSFIEGCVSYTRENSNVENDPYADMDDAP